MVTKFIQRLTQTPRENLFKTPPSSPSSLKTFLPRPPSPDKLFFMEFTCQDEPLGRVVIKMADGAGEMGKEFEMLVTNREGFGYQGSRVYACCKDEWCLLGDLIYQDPTPTRLHNGDWDPRLPEGHKEEDEGTEESSLRQLYRGARRGTKTTINTSYSEARGAVVAVASDYDLDTGIWTVGPQIKLCLSDIPKRSGHVLGVLMEGTEVAQRLSRMAASNYEPRSRITISKCGVL